MHDAVGSPVPPVRVPTADVSAGNGHVPHARAVVITTRDTPDSDPDLAHVKKQESKQLTDPFTGEYGARNEYMLLEPPYDPYWLCSLPEISSSLPQNIEALKVNVESWGHVFDYTGDLDDPEHDQEAQTQKTRLTSFFKMPNPFESFVTLRLKLRHDIETIGYACMEVTRTLSGELGMLFHVPAALVRLTAVDKDPIETMVRIERDGQMLELLYLQRFRRFVQMRGTRKIWFKEFGDPRQIRASDGKEFKTVDFKARATEILYFSRYNGKSDYGLPRHIGALFAIMGNRKSEELNYRFFKDNGIPPMVVMISGGTLTPDSMAEMKKQFEGGVEKQQKVLVLEAVSTEGSIDDKGLVKIEMKPLGLERQQDGTFQLYDDRNQVKVQSSYRLPSILTGKSAEYNFATATAARAVAEAQVFRPERNAFDEVINMRLLPALGITLWAFRTAGPPIDPDQAVAGMNAIANLGALTVNDAIQVGKELFNLPLQEVKEDWGDLPFQMVMGLLTQGKLAGLDSWEKEADPLDGLAGLFGGQGPTQVPTTIPADENGQPEGDADAATEKIQKGLHAVSGLLALRQAIRASLVAKGVSSPVAAPCTSASSRTRRVTPPSPGRKRTKALSPPKDDDDQSGESGTA